jgi:transposase-like protein
MDKSTKVTREKFAWLFEQPLDLKVSILEQHLSICQLVINQILEEEVKHLSGERYSHDKPNGGKFSRYGFNPGSVNIGGKKLKIDIPRVYNEKKGNFQTLESYQELKDLDAADEQTLEGVLHGLSTRDYKEVVDYLQEGFGLSKSSVSRKFIRASEEKLKEFESRNISQHRLIAIFIDGKYLARQQMIVVMGVTESGQKVMLGLLQTTSENSQAIGQLFIQLKERGLQHSEGLLFVTDGSKGIRKAIEEQFSGKMLIQRCIWHKRENVLSYLPEGMQEETKRAYHKALAQTSYQDAKKSLLVLIQKLEKVNRHAASSLKEGMEELLTLHKLGIWEQFSGSFSTTNCIESVNSQLKKYTGRVTYWSNSDQRYRWMAAALLEVEQKMRRVDNFKQLYKLKRAIKGYLERKTSSS